MSPGQQQLDTRALEVSSKALVTAELAADAIGQMRDELRALSVRNDAQHAENKTAMESGFSALHARISGEKDARVALERDQLRIWFRFAVTGGMVVTTGLLGLVVYLLTNDVPFQRRHAPAVSIEQDLRR